MDAVIKLGGSLSENPDTLNALGINLSQLAIKHHLAVVPGGGKFADVVRDLDARFHLPAYLSHRMAIRAMDQYGLFLSYVIPKSQTCDTFEKAERLSLMGVTAIFLPSKLLSNADPFEASWDVTSDTIAASVAVGLNAAKAIFVTDVDGIYSSDPKGNAKAKLLFRISAGKLSGLGRRTSVDKFLPKLLTKHTLDCYVVNGAHPERLEAALSGGQFIGTRVLPQK